MTRTREENAADLAQEEEQRAAVRQWLDGFRGVTIRNMANALDRDEDALAEALRGHSLMSEERAAGFTPELVASEALAFIREVEHKTAQKIDAVFGAPDLITGAGSPWYRIDSAEKAQLAARLGETAVDRFWNGTRSKIAGEDSHEWLVMLDDCSRAVVTMAAKKDGAETSYAGMLADSHVTGFRNTPAFMEYEADIRSACASLNLACEPNHMGEALEEPERNDPSL